MSSPAPADDAAMPQQVQMQPQEWALVREILRRQVPQAEVWAFGSRARRQAKPYSDLDLAIADNQPLTLARRAALAEAFSESNLPWRVDLVDWATTDDNFRRIIAAQRVLIQAPQP